MGERDIPVYRYTDEQMAVIHERISRRDEAWVDAVWDPILRHVHGLTLAEAGAQEMQIKVGDYGIPWDQSVTISKWAGKGGGMGWLSLGPTPVPEPEE